MMDEDETEILTSFGNRIKHKNPPTNMGSSPKRSLSPALYKGLVVAFTVFSLAGGYYAGLQPISKWRFFSWHPFLMTVGMVALPGIGAVTKKMGGYNNTKLHAILGWLSIFTSFAGLFCIYRNKEINKGQHLKSTHGWCGLGLFITFIGLGLVGSIFLHPDFGIDKTNKLIRTAHKWASRGAIFAAWLTAIGGLLQLTSDLTTVLLYMMPLMILVPFTLV